MKSNALEPSGRLSPGYISVAKAINLIESDTKATPKVDIAWLVRNIRFVETKHNFRIPLVAFKNPEGQTPQERGGTIHIGSTRVYVETDLQKETLRQAIRDKYREFLGKDMPSEEEQVRRLSTVTDEGVSGHPVVNTRSETEAGVALPDGLVGK